MSALGICQDCGCSCHSCATYSNNLDLHHEIEELRSKLVKSSSHMEQLREEYEAERRTAMCQADRLHEELGKMRDRYDRLLESYKKSQKVNHDLEDKLLSVVQKHEEERGRQESELISLNSKLMDAKYTISDLDQECERFRNDCFVAVQLLQCKPSNFIAHKLNTLPLDVQQRVKVHLTREEIINMEDAPVCNPSQQKMIRVPMPTFPPTAMVYSVNRDSVEAPQTDIPRTRSSESVPMDLIAKVLSPAETKRKPSRYYVCDLCSREIMKVDMATQTLSMGLGENNGYPRAVVANMRTNPPTIVPHYPGVHASKSRLNSFSSDIS